MENKAAPSNLYWQLVQTAFRAKHGMMKLAEKHDLTGMQVTTLCSMEADQPMPMNCIASLLACDASNVTGIVDRLLTGGLITRQEHPQDRRIKMITLTSKGRQLKEKFLADLPAADPGLLARLSQPEQLQLQKLLTIMLARP